MGVRTMPFYLCSLYDVEMLPSAARTEGPVVQGDPHRPPGSLAHALRSTSLKINSATSKAAS